MRTSGARAATLFLGIVFLAGSVALPAAAQRKQFVTWQVDGVPRRAMVYSPTEQRGGKMPLVFAFHGRGDVIDNFEYIDLHAAFSEAMVVYFQGLPGGNSRTPGWQNEPGLDGDRDLKLVDVALAALRAKYPIDDARIYATGFSNGANFTYLLWAERPDVFAAYAPVAAMMRPSVRPTKPRPVFHIGGMRDQNIPFEQQRDAVEIAQRVNGDAQPVQTWLHSGGHVWPSTASGLIAKFFRAHARE